MGRAALRRYAAAVCCLELQPERLPLRLPLRRGRTLRQIYAPPRLYSDEKVANREIRVWHFVIENVY
jgi:hypothetical protein